MSAEQDALAIYVVAGRDVSDALDMILECEDVDTIDFLHKMLTCKGTGRTDVELNELLAGPTKRRLDKLNEANHGKGSKR